MQRCGQTPKAVEKIQKAEAEEDRRHSGLRTCLGCHVQQVGVLLRCPNSNEARNTFRDGPSQKARSSADRWMAALPGNELVILTGSFRRGERPGVEGL